MEYNEDFKSELMIIEEGKYGLWFKYKSNLEEYSMILKENTIDFVIDKEL